MKSVRDLRASIKSLKESAFAHHGVDLPNQAIKDYLETMAMEKASRLIEDHFSQFSLTDLMRAIDYLSEDELPAGIKPRSRQSEGLN